MIWALAWLALVAFGVGASSGHAAAQTGGAGKTFAEPLAGMRGDAARGRAIIIDRRKGLCLLCHSGPFPEERFQGNLAPSLAGVGARMAEAEIRLRMVDSRLASPETIMPPYHAIDGLTRVAGGFTQKTILTASEIEDVVAFLVSLRD